MFASKELFFSKPSGYQISRSVRTRASASAYFGRTPSSTTNRQTWTWSSWIKRGALSGGARQGIFSVGGVSANDLFRFGFDTNDCLFINDTQASGTVLTLTTTPLYRDPSAWYHVVLAIDTTQSTSTNRVKLYVNGVQVTAFASSTYPTQNANTFVNTATVSDIGRMYNPPTATFVYLDGYITEINFVDGQALTPSSFGETNATTGVWQPKKYTGTYGTNGFYLNFSDNSNNTATTIGKDYSGNGNNWTPNNISVTAGVSYDSMLDVPTLFADGGNGRGNYCVMNPLDTASGVFANANLNVSTASGRARGTIFVANGKWYWEATITSMPSATVFGIADTSYKIGTSNDSQSRGYVSTGSKISNGSSSAYGASFITGDTIGIAYDVDAGTLTFYKNNTSQGTAYSDIAGYSWSPYVQGGFGADFNFGQRPFTYTPPTGFKALNTQNLPSPAILKGNQYFDANPYTGNGTSVSVTNGGFQPDFVWLKERGGANQHNLMDSVRGASFRLRTDGTGAEEATPGTFTFNSSGFTANTTNVSFNGNTQTYASWQWNAGGSTVTNTNGSISSQVRANTTAGFSVVTYTGTGANATVGHGLGVAPKMIIVKNRSAVTNWFIYNSNLASNQHYLSLNTTDASTNASGFTLWNSTNPTSTVFSIGTNAAVSGNTNNIVAYCFSEVAGYSKFGSYTGNGSADGPFVFCGFRPRWVMIKCSSSGGAGFEWELVDTSRNTSNVTNLVLYANLSDAEGTASTAILDITSNGFKLRGAANIINASSATYIFVAFAENPFKNSLAR
jgi:hypothetical protein